MLQHRVIAPTGPWRSIRFTLQQSLGTAAVNTTATASHNTSAESVRKPPSILSRLSERTPPGGDADAEQKFPRGRSEISTRHRATSFLSARSAQKRDHAAEKWFADVSELDINVVQLDDFKSLPRKERLRSSTPRRHEMRPKTDLSTLFAPSAGQSAVSIRLQTKKELGGDYASYLPDEHPDPHRFPVAYARLVLGRNKHIPLNAQTGALDVIQGAVQGKTYRQVV